MGSAAESAASSDPAISDETELHIDPNFDSLEWNRQRETRAKDAKRRVFQQTVQTCREELVKHARHLKDPEKYKPLLNKVAQLVDRVPDHQDQESMLDVSAMTLRGLRYQIEDLGAASSMTREQFTSIIAEKWKTLNNTHDIDWCKLGEIAACYSRQIHTVNFLTGVLELKTVQKERKKPERHKKEKVKELTQLDAKVDSNTMQHEADIATTKRIEMLEEDLHCMLPSSESKIALFHLVTHPRSFPRTVENLFHLSFLIKDGKFQISIEEGIPYVRTAIPPARVLEAYDMLTHPEHFSPEDRLDLTPSERKQFNEYFERVSKHQKNFNNMLYQSIIRLEQEDWQNIIVNYKITESLLTEPPEQEHETILPRNIREALGMTFAVSGE